MLHLQMSDGTVIELENLADVGFKPSGIKNLARRSPLYLANFYSQSPPTK